MSEFDHDNFFFNEACGISRDRWDGPLFEVSKMLGNPPKERKKMSRIVEEVCLFAHENKITTKELAAAAVTVTGLLRKKAISCNSVKEE
jgi:hypothetical protein